MPWSQSVPVGNDGGPAGQAELERLKHAAKIGVRRSFANLSPRIRIHNQLAIPGGGSRGVVRADGHCPDSSRIGPTCSRVESG
jgi:hypothetical protein